MTNIATEKKLMTLLKILDNIEKYIILIPEPFKQDIAKYKHAMELMSLIIDKIVNVLNNTIEKDKLLVLDPFLQKINKEISALN